MARSVLICDDDRLFILWLTRLLKEWGWTVSTASNVADAFESFKATPPSLLLTDLYIGDEKASDLLTQLKTLPTYSSTPKILISAASTDEMREKVGDADVTMLTKPLDSGRLKAILDEAVPEGEKRNDTTLSILILDSGGIQGKVLARMVEEAGAFVIIASDVENAKTLIRNVSPDGILLECEGTVTEAETISSYCNSNNLRLPPVAALCSVINKQIAERLLHVGVVDILLKPLTANRLREALEKISGLSRQTTVTSKEVKKSIIVVEDFMITAKMLERILTDEGYQVHVARRAELALDIIRQARPDLMLLDLNLPGMTGADLLKELNSSGLAVPTIISSGEKDSRKLHELRKLGILRVFAKPIVPDELISYIGGYLNDSTDQTQSRAEYDILLALADEAAGTVLASTLEAEKFKCKIVTDGYQALHEIMRRPRLVVLDIVISGLDGTAVLQRARGVLSAGKTRCLAIAEDLDSEIIAELKDLGAHDCLGRPYAISTAMQKIRDLLTNTAADISVEDLAREVLPDIRRAANLADEELFSVANRLGHNLRNTGELARMPVLATLAKSLEDAAKAKRRSSCESLLEDMKAEIDKAMKVSLASASN